MTPPQGRAPIHSSMHTSLSTNVTPDGMRELVTTTTVLEMAMAGDHLQVRFGAKQSRATLGPASDQVGQRRQRSLDAMRRARLQR